ncbi:hypothetical protein BJG93_34775 (plasmid) [Paraburkholderia sprentiae WSM5005]|uniref:Uncharacterized protein n=1 Tax=Paraburkholderia sprentiae WSM5005 TaxID=754502 RepID=A0ACA8AX35_9BURK|nr:hypothetical protein [Paraburkholderia sprentiae]APA90279.1 hypothetical protein BJG93_34775 [Paraburkholderia sprentiae WSM5005]
MADKELNLRACIGAFADEDGKAAVDIHALDVLNRNEDLLHLLIATGISFTRPADDLIGAEAGMQEPPIVERIAQGDVLATARRVAARVAASWVTDEDVARFSASV